MLMDVATYGVGLFTPVILGALGSRPGLDVVGKVMSDTRGSALVDVFLLVGFAIAIWAVPRFGRTTMQLIGFAGMAAGMAILIASSVLPSSATGSTEHVSLVFGGFILFTLMMNAGPNAVTFTLAPHLFPTSVRASASGLAAASAKVGATFGTFVVPQLQQVWGLVGVLLVMASVSAIGFLATLVLARAVRRQTTGGAAELD
jgi:putative MFS transporter